MILETEKTINTANTHLIRLNKYLKDMNICSRRKADDFIIKGFIKVNNIVITELGYKVDPNVDKIEISPELAQEKAKFRYILLNKPKGYVCSKSTIDGKTIFELLPKINDLTYAGRLDKDSHGLLILSNDGKFVYNIAGCEFKLEKEYIVRVNKPLTLDYLDMQSNGSIKLDGKQVRRAQVEAIDNTTYKIILTEGINRQIRRMAENQGYKVLDLERVRISHIKTNSLKTGKWRNLTTEEISSILEKNLH